MDKDILVVYGLIFLLVAATWTGSSFLKSSITGYAASDSDTTTASVTINEFISITLVDGFPITLGSLNPGTTNSSASTNPSNITIGGETNVVYNITINATDHFNSTEEYIIGIGNFTFVSNEFIQNNLVLLTEELLYEDEGCPCGTAVTNNSIWFYLDVPAGQLASSSYQADLIIGAEG